MGRRFYMDEDAQRPAVLLVQPIRDEEPREDFGLFSGIVVRLNCCVNIHVPSAMSPGVVSLYHLRQIW